MYPKLPPPAPSPKRLSSHLPACLRKRLEHESSCMLSLPRAWHLTEAPFKRKWIFPHKCHVSWRKCIRLSSDTFSEDANCSGFDSRLAGKAVGGKHWGTKIVSSMGGEQMTAVPLESGCLAASLRGSIGNLQPSCLRALLSDHA